MFTLYKQGIGLEGPTTGMAAASSDRRDIGKREALLPFVSIVCYPWVVEPRDEHYNTQHCKENPCFRKEKNRGKTSIRNSKRYR
jgi:hypothetical protein